ncbi:hypothetical protein QOT17_023874 [Balamuthia mandrillaris]
MEASAALDTLHEQLRKAQQEYLCMLQQSFQLELDIPSCPETECVAKEEEQHKVDEAAEHTRKAMEWLQQRIDNFVVFLASTSATLGNSSTCNTTAAAVSPPSPVPQISPIQRKCLAFPPDYLSSMSAGARTLPDIKATMIEAITSFQQKPGKSVHQLINQYSVLCNHLPDTFYNYLKAFFFGQALLPHIKSKYKQQTLRNKPQDVIAAFKLAVLIESEFPQPSLKDKGHSKSPQQQSPLPHTIGAVCAHCKTHNHTEDQCQKKACRLQRQSSQATSVTPASSSAPATRNPTSTLPQQTRAQLPARQLSPSSCSLNSMAFTQQQSNTPAPTAEQQDSIGDEEEYDEFYESQRALNSITITDNMPGPNDPICALMTINGCHVTAVIDSGASHSFMDPSIVDLVCAKTKQANYMVKLGHCETTATCAAETEPLAIGFSKRRFHHMFSVLPQPDGQSIILGRDFMHKSGMGITDIPIDYPEEPLPCSKDHDIT